MKKSGANIKDIEYNGISFIIPAFNEESRIVKILDTATEYLSKDFKDYEIIIVDDGSTDKTKEAVEHYMNSGSDKIRLIKNRINKGKGYSVRIGMLAAKYDLAVFSDADLATPISELKKLMNALLKGHDIVIASRNMKESRRIVKQPYYRQIMGKTFPIIVNILLSMDFKDTQCGFKLFKTQIAKKILRKQTIDRFAFDVEILYIAKKLGYRICEVPVLWIDKKDSKVSPFRDSWKMFLDIIKIRMNSIKDIY